MPLTDDQVISILESHRASSLGDEGSEVAEQRADAMDHYHGRPYGDEQDGRSQVVSRDLSEAVDWIMPAIMKVFVTGNIVDFIPTGPEDEALARQEADYVNHVIMKDNNGWLVIHDWVKDALLLKNGYVKHWWDESKKTTESEYEGLSEIELVSLFADLEKTSEIEVLEQEVETDEQGQEAFKVKLRLTTDQSRVVIEAIPTEEIRISKRARRGTQDSQFIEHIPLKTRSELIEMGMDKKFVSDLPTHNEEDNSRQDNARNSIANETEDTGHQPDRSMDEIQYGEAYVMMDYDEDGIAELRKIITAGNKIPPGKEWNEVVDTVAITSTSPKRVPHRHIGESIDDELSDLSRIKTVLTRQLLDNVYLTNNQQWIVNNRVNLQDFLQALPGGVKRINDDQPVSGSVEAVPVTPIINQVLPAIDYIDKVKDNRTGVNELSTNIDPDVLKQANNGVFMEGVSRASQKVEMIIRMIAETGPKELVLRVHEILMKHQDKARVIRLRGEYVNINPTEWKERTDLTVNVGIGTGTEEERRMRLMATADLAERASVTGLVGPEQVFNLFSDISATLGAEDPGRYVIDPSSEEGQAALEAQNEPQPNPLAEAEQIKGQIDADSTRLKAELNAQMEIIKMENANQQAAAERMSKETIEAVKLEISSLIEGLKIDLGKPGIGAGLQEGEQ